MAAACKPISSWNEDQLLKKLSVLQNSYLNPRDRNFEELLPVISYVEIRDENLRPNNKLAFFKIISF